MVISQSNCEINITVRLPQAQFMEIKEYVVTLRHYLGFCPYCESLTTCQVIELHDWSGAWSWNERSSHTRLNTCYKEITNEPLRVWHERGREGTKGVMNAYCY